MNEGDQNGQGNAQIGTLLQKKRREKGLSLKDVEQATKIRTRYLEGLEREDYSVLPDAVYVHGFLKTYANFLGLDGEQLSRELRERRASRQERQLGHHDEGSSGVATEPEQSPITLVDVERRRVSGVTVLTVALAVLVLAVVIGVLYFIGRGSQTPVEPASKPSQEEKQPAKEPAAAQETTAPKEPAAARETTAAAAKPAPETVRATVKVVDSSTGLTIYTDQTVADSRIAQPGFSRTFEARDAVTVSAANAGAVEVEVNGRNLGRLGNSSQGATRTFTRNSAG